jgi:aminopeptidase N
MVKWKQRSGLVAAIVLIAASVISANVPIEHFEQVDTVIAPFADDPSRLPENVIPVHYDLSIRAMTGSKFDGNRAYSGNVKIHIKIVSNTNSIILHNRNLNVTMVYLTGIGGGSPITTTQSSGSYDFFTIDTGSTVLSQGQEFLLELTFSGNMRTDMGGFYRSSYRVQGETVSRYEMIRNKSLIGHT